MDDTKARLKQAGLKLFLKRGYARTSIAALEKEAGLAPRAGGFYRHFSSKEELVLAIAREEVIERRDEFQFIELLPLADTGAELLLIAKGYLRAAERQRKYYPLIQEVRKLPAIAKFEQAGNDDMLDWLTRWISKKPAAEGLRGAALKAFTLNVLGGLLFYLTKRLEGVETPGLSDEAMAKAWASYWAPVLDAPAASARARRRA